ncbi:yjeF C-terminal region, hydroxyethylthiazole kinase-related/yjeF N-terminal region [Pricia antarctica]|uniref:Bifunctional NAD(P)H-hydrate repair enzyme n=1 Tax=Pricia antarctica TaxID=641691 RepID=A0A1G7FWD8_9FLAO|nr:NAD(P)H-hydrate dehydratase [Pricia antarctica]SDE80065.1 yjeF C-terminal region, hydroxyethylthiazole kinase-related/yjeF N-terminal region [Pricia antarctica]
MKIFSAEQIYAADKATIKKQDITSDALMERAATQLFNWLHLRLQGDQVKIHLFCGIGNNGGDGLALARQLQEHGYTCTVYVVNYSKKRSDDFLTNLKRLKDREVWPEFLEEGDDLPEIGREDILVDAIFGLGLNRPPDDWVVEIFEHLHRSDAFTLSVDIPSGLFTDKVPADEKAVVKANHTLSFQVPKLIFFLPQTGIYTEQWELLDIGLDTEFLMNTETDYELIGKNEVLSYYIPREKFSHKGTYGHSLIIGGSYGKIGAVHLAAKACLHTGSGLVTVYVPQCGYIPLQTNFPEAMVITDVDERHISNIDFDISPTVIGIGMGMGKDKKTVKAFIDFLNSNDTPLVVDADALNILSESKELLKKLPSQTVLTPHPKELERLIGKWDGDFEKLEMAKAFSKMYDCVLVIKGANTITVYDGKGYVNTTGNPGMATGGTGDVLTGMITGLVAQGYEPLRASIIGVYLHGRAGDIEVEKTGYQALTASSVIEGIGRAFLDLFAVNEELKSGREQS